MEHPSRIREVLRSDLAQGMQSPCHPVLLGCDLSSTRVCVKCINQSQCMAAWPCPPINMSPSFPARVDAAGVRRAAFMRHVDNTPLHILASQRAARVRGGGGRGEGGVESSLPALPACIRANTSGSPKGGLVQRHDDTYGPLFAMAEWLTIIGIGAQTCFLYESIAKSLR